MIPNRVVVVTGGAGFLGRNFANAIIQSGGKAVIADCNLKNAEECATEISSKSNPNSILAVEMEITSKSSINTAIELIDRKFGRIDVLVNSAYPRNKNWGQHFEEVSYQDFCENVNMHLGGCFLVSQQFSKYFKNKGEGHVINLSSIYGFCAPKFDIYNETEMTMPVEYAVIKSAITHLTRYLTNYYKGTGVRFNTLSPGGVLNQEPKIFIKNYNKYAGKIGMLEPQHLCGALVFLISNASSAINGQNIVIDDGWSV